jgi:hypothetical protein
MNPPDLASALCDVRKAYRLLYDYQRAVLDTVKYLGDQLGLTYLNAFPRFSDAPPRHGRGLFECWAWDWLGFMLHEINFMHEKEGNEDFRFTVWVFSDTGYFLGEGDDRCEPGAFAAAQNSRTMIGCVFFREWKEEEYGNFVDDKAAVRVFLEKGGELPASFKGMAGRCYDFTQFADEAAMSVVLKDLIEVGASAGFPLSRATKNE